MISKSFTNKILLSLSFIASKSSSSEVTLNNFSLTCFLKKTKYIGFVAFKDLYNLGKSSSKFLKLSYFSKNSFNTLLL